MRILLLGATGQVGTELLHTLAPLGSVVAANRTSADLCSADSLRQAVLAAAPDLIVNAAAYTAVDKAESEPDVARQVNAVAPGVLGELAHTSGAALVQYSTDYVFDGQIERPYREDDAPSPLNVYGRTKLEGERAVAASGAAHLILRTTWVYGTHGRNFVLTIRRLAREQSVLRVVNDQVGAPTWSRLIAEATARIAGQGSQDIHGFMRERSGVYHLTCAGQTSWYDFAADIVSSLRGTGETHLARVEAVTSAAFVQAAKRPAWSVLDNRKIAEIFGVHLPDWRVAAKQVFDELNQARASP
jgi:dTDP-4-dehydrorhamnose reductase